MVQLAVCRSGDVWFGIAWADEAFVATVVGATQREAASALRSCLPPGVTAEPHGGASAFLDRAIEMLAAVESGNERHKQYQLSPHYLSEPMFRIYSVAAAIPLGFVTTYGAVARAAGSEARAVGRAMATNPLYPIVPCHRVVGSDLSLVGYGGKQDAAALRDKFARLAAEARGEFTPREISVAGSGSSAGTEELGSLEVYPVEWLIRATREADERRLARVEAEKERQRLDALQLRLF